MVPLVVAIDARLISRRSTGDTTYWTGLLHGFSRLSGDFRLLLMAPDEDPGNIPADPRFEWVTVGGRNDRWWSLVTFPLEARRRGAHVVHAQYNISPLARQRKISTIHDVSFFIEPSWFRPRDRKLLQTYVPITARKVDRVITVSETSKADIVRFTQVNPEKVAVTYLDAHPRIERLDRKVARQMVSRLVGADEPFALTVSTRWPRKNMDLAVRAMDRIPDHFPHRLVLTGKEGWGERAEGRRVRITGYVDDAMLSALYSAADLYLCPSRYEGFGLPLIEAFHCGCPVICSTGGSLPEVAGDAAHVEPSWEVADWAQAIDNLLRDDARRQDLVERGFRRREMFSWEKTAAATLAIYQEVAAAK